MTDTQKHETFGYELTEKGKLWFFGHVFDDFESYIKAYWNKTQSEECDDSYDESFRIDYIDNQFEDDFDVELLKRLEMENNDEAGDLNVCYTDIGHVNAFEVKNTPENLEKIKDEPTWVYNWEVWDVEGDDDSVIHVQTLAEWSWMYFTRKVYSDLIKENFSMNLEIPLEDIQKEHISGNG